MTRGNLDKGIAGNDFDRARGSLRGAAVLRRAGRNPAAAIAAPAEYLAIGKQRQRVVPAAADRCDDVAFGGGCLHGERALPRGVVACSAGTLHAVAGFCNRDAVG